MAERVRWYNRLAAWLYDVICQPLQDLAIPAWVEEAERDAEQQYLEEEEARRAEFEAQLDGAYQEGHLHGYLEGRDAEDERRPF